MFCLGIGMRKPTAEMESAVILWLWEEKHFLMMERDGIKEKLFEGSKSKMMGKTDNGREHHSPYSSQNPDYCGNSKMAALGTWRDATLTLIYKMVFSQWA